MKEKNTKKLFPDLKLGKQERDKKNDGKLSIARVLNFSNLKLSKR